ncbi:hypothetical protein ACLB2K_057003 [Fragaria x ananassa]
MRGGVEEGEQQWVGKMVAPSLALKRSVDGQDVGSRWWQGSGGCLVVIIMEFLCHTVYRNPKPRICSTYQTLFQMKMGSNSKRRERYTEDRLSELPDAILCHILSFLSTVEAVKTSVLSHRWENLWASVPTIDVCDYDPKEFDFDSFTMFLDRVLLAHDSSKVHRFRICCTKMVDPLLFDYWVSTAMGCNVVELDLDIYPLGPEHSSLAPQCFQLPGSLFMLKSLEKLKLSLKSFVTITPEPSWFPSLKFLHVSVAYAGSHLMENLFTCCPALEELTFEAEPEYDDDSLTFYRNLLAIYISNNAKSLNEAKIDCTDLHAVQELGDHLDAADNLHRLFTGILNVTYLSVSAPILGDPHIVHQYLLPTFVNLKHLELLLHACSSWQPLISFLNASPNLESLVLKKSRDCLCRHNPDELHHEWNPPEYVLVCLSSQLKSICIRGYKGTLDQMKVAEYLLKHGEVLNKTLYHMEMGSSSKHSKRCAEDRLSELPNAFLCHILSFLSTVEAVKTCVLSHRWENVWGAVPTIDISDHDRDGKESNFDSFSVFIDRVLSAHESVKVHLFRLGCFSTVDPLQFDYWVRTAIGCNVVQLDLGIFPPQSFELPGALFMLKGLEKLSLSLHSFITITPEPSWFPNLKFLNVSVTFASSHLMENFFSCCPVLEELIFDAWEYDGDSDFNINISAPNLKILQIRLFQKLYDHGHKLFINAYAPNLEKFTFKGHLLAIQRTFECYTPVSYSSYFWGSPHCTSVSSAYIC